MIFLKNMSVCEKAIIGKRFTIVIPKAVREKVGLKEGQKVLVYAEAGKIVIEPLPTDPFKVLKEVVREPYDESVDEGRAEEWLKSHASR